MPEPLKRSHIKREAAQARAYSQAVITEGGRTIWLAGQVAIEDPSGRSLAADFDGQVREVFARLGRRTPNARVPGSGRCSWHTMIHTGGSFMPDVSELELTTRSSAGYGGDCNRSPLPRCRCRWRRLGQTGSVHRSSSAACIGFGPNLWSRSNT